MAFASGQRVTAAMLNQITRNDLEVNVTADDVVTTTETDLSGATLSVTTIQPNTKIFIAATLDCEATGSSDFSFVRCYVDGAVQPDNLKWQATGRFTLAKVWIVTVGTAKTLTVKLTRQKIGTANTCTIYSGHSNLVVSGNGIS